MQWVCSLPLPVVGAPLVAGVLGARDGIGAVPEAWVARLEEPDRWRLLAKRLVSRLGGSGA